MEKNKTKTMSFRCSEKVYKQIEEGARKRNLNLSEYITRCCIDHKGIDRQNIVANISGMFSYINKGKNKVISKKEALLKCEEGLKRICQELN